jgi:hypothetical protein
MGKMFAMNDPWMARALRARKRFNKRSWKDIVWRHHSTVPLLDGFSGSLLFTPEIIPVCIDFRRIIRAVKMKPEDLLQLNSRQFEELVAEIWRSLGYETELTAQTKVRALYGVRAHEKATKGILATTSTFTRGAKAFFDDHIWELEPRDFDGVVQWVRLAAKKEEAP